jgi:hypothetical protein
MVDKIKSYYANFDLYVLFTSSTIFIFVIYLLNNGNRVFCTGLSSYYTKISNSEIHYSTKFNIFMAVKIKIVVLLV